MRVPSVYRSVTVSGAEAGGAEAYTTSLSDSYRVTSAVIICEEAADGVSYSSLGPSYGTACSTYAAMSTRRCSASLLGIFLVYY